VGPNVLAGAGDGTGRLFVADQSGAVRVIAGGVLQATPYLDLSSRLVALNSFYDERGLLGLTFHPGFANPASPGYGKLYTYASEPVNGTADFTVPLDVGQSFNNQGVLLEWTVPDVAAGASPSPVPREVLRVDEPQSNHNGGMIEFGPDGYLYLSLGDGGAADDQGAGHSPQGNGQDNTNVLGSVLRIDPTDTSGGKKFGVPASNPFVGDASIPGAIFAYGLRNPFRFSFDTDPVTRQISGAATGKLIIADVGQNDIEEVNVINPATDGGTNFGWHVKEGTFLFDPNGSGPGFVSADSPGLPAGLTDPVLEYDHDEGIAVVGGFVYRGSAIPELVGKYVFGDFSQGFGAPAGRLFYADLDTGQIYEFLLGPDDLPLGLFVKGIGRDADGELYVLASSALGPGGSSGVVLKIVPEPATIALLAFGALGIIRRRRMPAPG